MARFYGDEEGKSNSGSGDEPSTVRRHIRLSKPEIPVNVHAEARWFD